MILLPVFLLPVLSAGLAGFEAGFAPPSDIHGVDQRVPKLVAKLRLAKLVTKRCVLANLRRSGHDVGRYPACA